MAAQMPGNTPSIARSPLASIIPSQVFLPIVAILGYTAFLITGFGQSLLGSYQPLPVFVFFGLLLLALQVTLLESHSWTRTVYTLLTSVAALFIAYSIVIDHQDLNAFTRGPYTYVILQIVFTVAFVYDAAHRQIINRRESIARRQSGIVTMPDSRPEIAGFPYGPLTADFAGLAILYYILWGLFTLLTNPTLGLIPGQAYVQHLDFKYLIGVNLGSLNSLPTFDLVIAIAATAITLLLIGIIGVLAGAVNRTSIAGGGAGATTSAGPGAAAVAGFGGALGNIIRTAVNPVLRSLRLVLGPLFWLASAFSIALTSLFITQYFQANTSTSNGNIADLFNPLSRGAESYGGGIAIILLSIFAVGTVFVSVALVEFDQTIIDRMLAIFGAAGRAVSLALIFFTISLAAVNAVVILVNQNYKNEPFQVGGFAVLSLAMFIFFVGGVGLLSRLQKKPPSASSSAA